MFVDASALVAIITDESDANSLYDRLAEANRPVTSPLAVWETVVAIARIGGMETGAASALLHGYLAAAGIEIAPVPPAAAAIALDAFDRYRKGRHPAALNFGDCFAYACARCHDVPLLYTGGDFALTDIAGA